MAILYEMRKFKTDYLVIRLTDKRAAKIARLSQMTLMHTLYFQYVCTLCISLGVFGFANVLNRSFCFLLWSEQITSNSMGRSNFAKFVKQTSTAE